MEELSLETPPMIVPISFADAPANEAGLIPKAKLQKLFEEKINALDELIDEYSEQELEEAA